MIESERLANLLRERNLKATSSRLEVLQVISNYGKAIGFSEMQRSLQNFDRVTLYRTIHSLMENGIIHKALIEEKETFYALCAPSCTSETHNHQHIHFKCSVCNGVTCVQSDQSISVSIPNHVVRSFEIEATGICAACV